jgi:Reverse transcriptase (RNA-dependent DNA polymerase)
VAFLAELNNLQLWSTDVSNAYLEAFTKEKLYVIAGPEMGNHRLDHLLVLHKALYGLRTSGARWHDRLFDCLREMGFFPCKAESDIWMRACKDKYEYIAVYVDDLAIAMVDPKAFVESLETTYGFKFKGTGPISVHLGMDLQRDEDGTLYISSRKYIERCLLHFEKICGHAPKTLYSSPLEKGDHPEIDDSELLDEDGVRDYQSLIGVLQWLVSIVRFDIHTAVMTLSSFRAAPRQGHLERVKRIFGYVSKMRHAAIRIRTEEPDYSDLPEYQFDWSRSVYGESQEIIPQDCPPPLGNFVTSTHYVDANLLHDLTTGRSVTGILHLVNKTPVEWYSKKQATVETATYGSEFVAARTCVEQIIDLRHTLRYLGVPIRDKSYMFGDNKSVVDSSTQVHAKLHKRHNILSFHRVREAIASGYISYSFINGDINPADLMSKHWGYTQVWDFLRALLFWSKDTGNIVRRNNNHDAKGSDKI